MTTSQWSSLTSSPRNDSVLWVWSSLLWKRVCTTQWSAYRRMVMSQYCYISHPCEEQGYKIDGFQQDGVNALVGILGLSMNMKRQFLKWITTRIAHKIKYGKLKAGVQYHFLEAIGVRMFFPFFSKNILSCQCITMSKHIGTQFLE